MTQAAPEIDWQQDVFDVIKDGGVNQIAYVPDAGHATSIRAAQADPDIRGVVLTTEEEGVALVGGAWLGGQRAVLLMQSSGVGNCVNMFSLLHNCRFPLGTVAAQGAAQPHHRRARQRPFRRDARAARSPAPMVPLLRRAGRQDRRYGHPTRQAGLLHLHPS